MFTKIPMAAGVFVDDTPLNAEGYYTSTNKARFVRGVIQAFAGWEEVTSTNLTGKCRGICSWADEDAIKWAAFGTHTNLYGLTDAVVYDITPIVERGELSNPFSTTNASTAVTVADTAHGRAVGDGVNFANASAVGGITVNGSYTVTTVVDANSYTITHSSAATSTAGPGGGTVDYKYYLAIGLPDAIGAAGYGTGTYSSGTYSTSSATVFYLRTWSMGNYQQNLIACPRGGKIYEWHPATSASELVTNGSFATPTDWTAGTGWSLTATNAAATLSDAALSQTVTLEPMAYYLLEADITRAAGSMSVTLAGSALGANVASSISLMRTVYGGNAGGSQTLAFTGGGFTGTVDNVTLKQMLTAEEMTNAPSQNTCVVVTPDAFIMSCGTIESATGNFNPLHIRWSDRAPNHHTWTPANGNLSGSWTLGIGSRIVAAKCTNNEVLIWTDAALFAGSYVNNSAIVYSFRVVGVSCGLLGANAATVHAGVAYWWSTDGSFYRYAGGAVEPMQCTLQQDAFNNIAFVQQDKVFASPIGAFQDVIWLYPDARDGNEVSRYVLLCTQEPSGLPGGGGLGAGVWANGTFDRTAWTDSDVFQNPIAVDTEGAIYYQERGDSANGGTFTWSFTTGAFKTGDGETLWQMSGFIPDFQTLSGGAALTVNSYLWPQSTPVTHGPFNITSATDHLNLMSDAPVGRMQSLTFQGSASPAAMRSGFLMMEIEDTGMEN